MPKNHTYIHIHNSCIQDIKQIKDSALLQGIKQYWNNIVHRITNYTSRRMWLAQHGYTYAPSHTQFKCTRLFSQGAFMVKAGRLQHWIFFSQTYLTINNEVDLWLINNSTCNTRSYSCTSLNFKFTCMCSDRYTFHMKAVRNCFLHSRKAQHLALFPQFILLSNPQLGICLVVEKLSKLDAIPDRQFLLVLPNSL